MSATLLGSVYSEGVEGPAVESVGVWDSMECEAMWSVGEGRVWGQYGV